MGSKDIKLSQGYLENSGGTRRLGGVRGWSEGTRGSLGVGSGGNMFPGGIVSPSTLLL